MLNRAESGTKKEGNGILKYNDIDFLNISSLIPQYERPRHTGEGCQDHHAIGTPLQWEKAERVGIVQPEEEEA